MMNVLYGIFEVLNIAFQERTLSIANLGMCEQLLQLFFEVLGI